MLVLSVEVLVLQSGQILSPQWGDIKEIVKGDGEGGLPLVLGSEAGNLDGRVAVVGTTEVMTTDLGELTQVHMVAQRITAEVLVPGHDIRGCGVACAEVGRGVVAAAVGEGTGVAVATVAHTRASRPPAGGTKHKKR